METEFDLMETEFEVTTSVLSRFKAGVSGFYM